jgi:RNA polymerase sigma factor (sigma-70 family)
MLFNRQPAMVSKKIVADRLSKLTDREKMVMHHLLQGKLNKEIANELGVSQRTVEGHRARIREKMQARGIADLIRMLG